MSHRKFSILNPEVEAYLESLLSPRDKVLSDLEKDAKENSVPIIGPLCGNILTMLASSCRAKNILEIGTATGYSGTLLARVAKKNSGKLTTVELDPQRIAKSKKTFSEAGVLDSVEILEGDAREIVPRFVEKHKGTLDFIFLDVGDKSLYVELLKDCVEGLRVGGYLAADNTLGWGRVLVPLDDSKGAERMRNFNMLVYSDRKLIPVLIPLREGMTICLKIGN